MSSKIFAYSWVDFSMSVDFDCIEVWESKKNETSNTENNSY